MYSEANHIVSSWNGWSIYVHVQILYFLSNSLAFTCIPWHYPQILCACVSTVDMIWDEEIEPQKENLKMAGVVIVWWIHESHHIYSLRNHELPQYHYSMWLRRVLLLIKQIHYIILPPVLNIRPNWLFLENP